MIYPLICLSATRSIYGKAMINTDRVKASAGSNALVGKVA